MTMDLVFKALADKSRRSILDRLYIRGGQTLGELYQPFEEEMTRQAVMKHLAILGAAGLVTTVWSGREKRHYLNPVPIHAIQNRWIKKFERQRLEAISALKGALESSSSLDSAIKTKGKVKSG